MDDDAKTCGDLIREFLKEEISLLAKEMTDLKKEMEIPNWKLKSPDNYPKRTQAIVSDLLNAVIPKDIKKKFKEEQDHRKETTVH
jgi:hypothetical protein